MAALSLGTEGIVAQLYAIFRQGLLKAGLGDDSLSFFNIHISCDDLHAATLEEILLFYAYNEIQLDYARTAMLRILDLRDYFFKCIYQNILNKRLDGLTSRISTCPKEFIPHEIL